MERQIWDLMVDYWQSIIEKLPQLIMAVIILTVFILVGGLLYRLVRNRAQRAWEKSFVVGFVAQVVRWILIAIGVLSAMYVLGLGSLANNLLAGAGISAIVVGFAFKDIAENFLSGVILAIRRPFRIGDIIEVNGFKGPVRALDLRTTHIRVADGRDIWIPNAMLMKNVLTNYTRDGLLRQEFSLGIDPGDDIERVRKLILDLLKADPEVLDQPTPGLLTEGIGTNSIDLKVLFWIDILDPGITSKGTLGESTRSKIVQKTKDLLLQEGFSLPANVLEHKTYRDDEPVRVMISEVPERTG